MSETVTMTSEKPEKTDNQVKIGVQRTYLKTQRCECPNAPAIFKEKWKPEINTELSIHTQRLEADVYEVSLRLQVTAKVENKTAANIYVEQAGIITIQEASPEQIELLLNVYCPNLLYPYASRAVSTLASDSSLGQIYLAPVNFEEMYRKNKASQGKTPSVTIESPQEAVTH